MLQVSDGFLAALSSPQQISVRANVDKGGQRLYTDLPITGGSVSVSRGRDTRRELNLTVAPRLRTGTYTQVPALPGSHTDPLSNSGQEITVWWQLHYIGGAIETIPLGVFRIDDVSGSIAHDDEVTLRGRSREAWIIDDRLVQPRTIAGPSAVSLIGQLVHETLADVEVVAQASRDARVPSMTVEEDRWGAIAALAASIPAQVYADPWGRIVIADLPTVDSAPVWQVKAGPGGVLVRASSSSSRSDVRNAVVVRGESPSGDFAPLQATVYDDDPSSPTRYGDPGAGFWGRAPHFETNAAVTSLEQARAIARTGLALHTGAARSLDLSSVPNPALEACDVIDVIPDPGDPAGSVRRHILDAFTIPLVPGGQFP
ncbi:MAG: DUF5047 domain-containing protein, partial [Actinomycetota bacterium]|nr:DUF5047 domain-containing protein [Actinomycetota bacterium]